MIRFVATALLVAALLGLAACNGNASSEGAERQAEAARNVAAQDGADTAQGSGTGQTSSPKPAPEPSYIPTDDTIKCYALPQYADDFSDTFMVGDSVMHLVSGSIFDLMPAATINASSGRTMETGGPNEGESPDLGILDIIRADGGNGYERYVIGAPANEGGGMSYATGEEIVCALGGKPVWFVTQMVTNNSSSTANTNSTIDVLCANYPNAHKIDWYQACIEHPEYLVDNAHASDEGARVYADLIYTALTH